MSSNAPSPAPSRKPKPVPERFQVAKTTLWFDRIMTKTIIGGGFTVIVAVFGILFFLLAVTVPLFQNADVDERQHLKPSSPVPGTWGLDPSGTLPFVYGNGKNIFFLDKTTGNLSSVPVTLPEGETVCAHSYNASLTAYPIATESGKVGLIHVHSGLNVHGRTNAHGPDKAGAEAGPLYPLTESGSVPGKISGIAYADAGERKIFTATVETEQGTRLLLMTLEESRSLLHEGELAPSGFHDLTDQLEGRPTAMLPGASGDSLVIATDTDKLLYFSYDENGETWVRRQTIPSPLGKGEKMTSVNWLFGDMSLVIGGDKGSLKIFSLYPHTRPDGTSLRLFGQTRQFSPLDGPVQHYAASGINRSFLVSTPRELRLCYGTTADIRWNSGPLEFVPVQLAANTEFNSAIAIDSSGNIHFFSMEDKHPEAGSKALVGKIWYEGYDSPKWLWQSVGGTDDYESKLSLMPLVFGTLKGTLHGSCRQTGGKTRHGNHGLPPFRSAGFLRSPLPGPQNGRQGSRPALHGHPHSRPGNPHRMVLDHPARSLAQQIQPRRGIHCHDSRHPALRLVLLGISGLLAGTAPHQPLPQRHGPVGRRGLPGRQFLRPVAQRIRHAL